MKRNHKSDKRYDIFLAISIIGLVACFAVSIFLMYRQAVLFQQNVIGSLYLSEGEHAKRYLNAIFQTIQQENIDASWEAFAKYGYTTKGPFFIGNTMGILQICISIVLIAILFGGIFVFLCIANKKQYQEKCRDLEEKIRRLKKQQSKEEYLKEQNLRLQHFVENIAHQIKTPVSRVAMSLDILEMDIKDAEKRKHIEECYQHMESINILMKKLMDIGRMEAGKVLFRREKLFLCEILQDTIHGICSDETRVTLICPEDMVYYGDYEWLKEAFSNIIKNALEADCLHPVEISCKKTQDYVKVAIRDYGKGVHEIDIPSIFDRFYQPKEIKTGHNGIGLNLSKLIIEGHQGTVYVYNHANGGAVFQINLPVYESLKYTKV